MVEERAVEFDETKQEKITVFAGLGENKEPFIILTLGEKEVYLPPNIALHVGLTLQQVAYSAVFLADATNVAERFFDKEKLLEFHAALVNEVFSEHIK